MEMMEELLIVKKDLKSALEEINLGRIEAKEAIAGLEAKVDAYEKVATAKQSGEIPNPQRSRPAPSVSAPPSQIPPPRESRTSERRSNRKSSSFLRKPKMLYIGDSVGHNADFSGVERAVNCRIRTRKAYSSVHYVRAEWPKKNFMDITSSKDHHFMFANATFCQLWFTSPLIEKVSMGSHKFQ